VAGEPGLALGREQVRERLWELVLAQAQAQALVQAREQALGREQAQALLQGQAEQSRHHNPRRRWRASKLYRASTSR